VIVTGAGDPDKINIHCDGRVFLYRQSAFSTIMLALFHQLVQPSRN